MATIMFLGGWLPPLPFAPFTWVPGVIWFTLKALFMFFLFAMAKAMVPRYRYDQLMRLGWKVFLPLSLAMVAIVAASNFLVRFPFEHFGLGELLTWGAFSYPVAFLVTDLANRRFGVTGARKVVVAGFAIAVILSIWLATPRMSSSVVCRWATPSAAVGSSNMIIR